MEKYTILKQTETKAHLAQPACRTAWHTHPLGQILIVPSGSGLAQRWDGPVEEIRLGEEAAFSQ
jgi:quercetin dioxygenase-like cupin family protein